MPTAKRAKARNARGCDLSAKARVYGCRKILAVLLCRSSEAQERRAMPIASPIINTSVWSAIDDGFVRKKKPIVMWKREMELIMVAPDMRPMAAVVEELFDGGEAVVSVFGLSCFCFGQQPGYMMCLMGSRIVSLVARSPHRPVRTPTVTQKYLGVSVSPVAEDTRGAPVRLTPFDDQNLSSANKSSLQPSCEGIICPNR